MKQNGQFASFYLKIRRELTGSFAGEPAENPYKCTNVVMEHDHIGHTPTANLATHTKHQRTRRPRRGCRKASSSSHLPEAAIPTSIAASQTEPRLPQSVFVDTPPRGGDSDIIRSFPNIASQTALDPMPAYANNWPHAPRTDISESDDELQKGNMQDLRRLRTNPSDTSGRPTTEAPPRPNFSSTHHLCQTAPLDLAELPGHKLP